MVTRVEVEVVDLARERGFRHLLLADELHVSSVTIGYDTPERLYLTLNTADSSYKVGEWVTVLYAPESPDKAAAYERCQYRAVSPRGREGAVSETTC